MNCTNLRGFKELPEYLSANIQVHKLVRNNQRWFCIRNDNRVFLQGLNLSNSQVLWSQGINDTFAKFKDSLLLLDNSHTYHSTFNGYAIYRVLTKLEYLDISYTCVYHRGMFDGSFQVFPSSLKILKFNGCPTEHLDIEYLISLEELHMRSNNLKILPRINVKAPFWFLDLAENELVELSPMNFTKLCALREVFLNSTPGHGLNQPKYYCECISLKNWFANKIMKGSISCSSPSPTPGRLTNLFFLLRSIQCSRYALRQQNVFCAKINPVQGLIVCKLDAKK